MAFSITFAALTNPVLSYLDTNFNQAGKLGILRATLSGTNTIAMALTSDIQPTITAYEQGLRVSGIAASTNTGATTAQLGSLAALNVYKDTPAGPVALSGGEIIANCAVTFIYDSALNSGVGGWHLVSQVQFGGGFTLTNGTLSTIIQPGSIITPSLVGSFGSFASLRLGATSATVTGMLAALATLTYSAIAPQASQSQPVTVTGASVNDIVGLGLPAAPDTGCAFNAFVAAAGTVNVRMTNATASTIAGATLVMHVGVTKMTP